jgi:hypothetical protein
MPVINRFADLALEISEWRRKIHRHPEILFETHRTSALVVEKLRAFGCDEVVTGIGRTGVVGVIRGRSNTSRRVIGLRADMDALPMQEETRLPYASQTDGAMHACGHDGHTAMLLGAARYLAETRNFDRTAVVIFQPAEEGGGGGREMVKDGLMERFGIGLWPAQRPHPAPRAVLDPHRTLSRGLRKVSHRGDRARRARSLPPRLRQSGGRCEPDRDRAPDDRRAQHRPAARGGAFGHDVPQR